MSVVSQSNRLSSITSSFNSKMAHRSFKVGLHKLVGDYMVAMSIFYIVYVSTKILFWLT